jgi:hypothetical protein
MFSSAFTVNLLFQPEDARVSNWCHHLLHLFVCVRVIVAFDNTKIDPFRVCSCGFIATPASPGFRNCESIPSAEEIDFIACCDGFCSLHFWFLV